jgi:hypothetical protein
MPKKSNLSTRGGARPGAGRPKKATNFSSADGIASPQRMWIYTPTLDASKSLTPSARIEQTKKSFFLYENIGLAARAVDGVAKFVGPLIPQAKTSDESWNRLAEQAFEDACGNSPFGCDVSKSVNFYDAQELLVKQMALAGDVFWQKQTSNSDRAMFRIVPGENVGSSHSDVANGWVDGVKISKLGAPTRYRVLKAPGNYAEYNEISADDLTRVGKVDRVGQVRSRPWLHRAADHLQDITEILGYEKMSAKLGSSLAFVITSPEAGQIGLGSSLQKVQSGSGTPVTKDLMTDGSIIPQLKPGENRVVQQRPPVREPRHFPEIPQARHRARVQHACLGPLRSRGGRGRDHEVCDGGRSQDHWPHSRDYHPVIRRAILEVLGLAGDPERTPAHAERRQRLVEVRVHGTAEGLRGHRARWPPLQRHGSARADLPAGIS